MEGSDGIDIRHQRFPHCIVWSPLPPITWLLPFIGHMGIASKDGIMYDFAGPYTIGVGRLAFGAPTRYLQLDLGSVGEGEWDAAVMEGCEVYSKRMHNLFCDNCHSHVARCLNVMQYGRFRQWNMVILAFWMFFFGRFTSFGGFVKTWLPFAIVVGLIAIWKGFA